MNVDEERGQTFGDAEAGQIFISRSRQICQSMLRFEILLCCGKRNGMDRVISGGEISFINFHTPISTCCFIVISFPTSTARPPLNKLEDE